MFSLRLVQTQCPIFRPLVFGFRSLMVSISGRCSLGVEQCSLACLACLACLPCLLPFFAVLFRVNSVGVVRPVFLGLVVEEIDPACSHQPHPLVPPSHDPLVRHQHPPPPFMIPTPGSPPCTLDLSFFNKLCKDENDPFLTLFHTRPPGLPLYHCPNLPRF